MEPGTSELALAKATPMRQTVQSSGFIQFYNLESCLEKLVTCFRTLLLRFYNFLLKSGASAEDRYIFYLKGDPFIRVTVKVVQVYAVNLVFFFKVSKNVIFLFYTTSGFSIHNQSKTHRTIKESTFSVNFERECSSTDAE